MDVNNEPQLASKLPSRTEIQIVREPSVVIGCKNDKEVIDNPDNLVADDSKSKTRSKVNDEIVLTRRRAMNCLHVSFPNPEFDLSLKSSKEVTQQNEGLKKSEVPRSLKELSEYQKHLCRVREWNKNEKQRLKSNNCQIDAKKRRQTLSNKEAKSENRCENESLKEFEYEKQYFQAKTRERLKELTCDRKDDVLRRNPEQQKSTPEELDTSCTKSTKSSTNSNADIFVQFKKTNVYFQLSNGDTGSILQYKNLLGRFFGNVNLSSPASIDEVSDYLVPWIIKNAVDEYLDVADDVWTTLKEIVFEGINIRLKHTLDVRRRIRLFCQTDVAVIQWVATRSCQSAISLVANGLSHLLQMHRLPNASLMVSLAQRSRQLIIDSILESLHQKLPNRSEMEIQSLWRETMRVVKNQLDVYTKLIATSWIKDRNFSVMGFPEICNGNSCSSAMLLISTSVVLSLCQSELTRVFVSTFDIAKEEFESVVSILLRLPRNLMSTTMMWADSDLWFLINEIGKIPTSRQICRIVFEIVRKVFKTAHVKIREFLHPKQSQILEDTIADVVVDSLVTILQQRLSTHYVNEEEVENVDNKIMDEWMKRLLKNAAMITESVADNLEKQTKEKSLRKRKLVAKNLSSHIIKLSKMITTDDDKLVAQEVNKYKILHQKHIDQILSTITSTAESIVKDGVVPSKKNLSEVGLNLASDAASRAIQDLKLSYQGLTIFPKCRIFMEFICNSLTKKVEQKGKDLLDRITEVDGHCLPSFLESTAITRVLELELLIQMVGKMEEILEVDRQDCLHKNIDGSSLELCKLDDLVTQYRFWIVDGIVNTVRYQVDVLLKDTTIAEQELFQQITQEATSKIIPEAMKELELRARCLLEESNITLPNFDGFLRELASHVFNGSCANLKGEIRKQCVPEKPSASTLGNSSGKSPAKISTELYTSITRHPFYVVIQEVQKDIARQIVKLIEEETVLMNIGQLQIDSLKMMDELAFGIVVKIIQMVEERIPSGGPELVAIWESPLLEYMLKEAAKILRLWESENKNMLEALMKFDAENNWFVDNAYDVETSKPENFNFMEEQVVHGIINRILTIKVLSSFEQKMSNCVEDEGEQSCTCSEEDRRFIWDITSLIFPSVTPEEGHDIENLHLAVHKFANRVFNKTSTMTKTEINQDDIDLLHCLMSVIVKEVLNSKSIQSQLMLDTMMSSDSFGVFNAVVAQEASKMLVKELSPLLDRNILGILETTRSEICEAVTQYTLSHFPLLSQGISTRLMVRAMDFGDATGQFVMSMVDDVREHVFYIVDELSELKKGVEIVKENIKEKCKKIESVLSTITNFVTNIGECLDFEKFVDVSRSAVPKSIQWNIDMEQLSDKIEKNKDMIAVNMKSQTPVEWYVDTDLLPEKLIDKCRRMSQSKIDTDDEGEKVVDTTQKQSEKPLDLQIREVLCRVKDDVRRQLVSTRVFVTCLARFARRHLREAASKLRNKLRIDLCFYVYEILPPPILRSTQNSNLQICPAKSLHSGFSMSTLSDVDTGDKMPQKIVSLDSVSTKRDNIFSKFRSLDGISIQDADKVTLDFLPESKKSTMCKNDICENQKPKLIPTSLENLFSRHITNDTVSTLQKNLHCVCDSNRVFDTLTDILLKVVVDNFKQEILLLDLTSTPINCLPKHGSTSLPVICVNPDFTDVMKGPVEHIVDSVECRRYSDVSVGDKSRYVDSNGVCSTRSHDLLLASIICQTQRMAMKWLSTKPTRYMGVELVDKISKELADKFIIQTKVLLKQTHGQMNDVKDVDLSTTLGKIMKNIEEELQIGQMNFQCGLEVPEQVICLTKTLLKQVCVELREGMMRGTGEAVIRQISTSEPKRKMRRRLRFKKVVVQKNQMSGLSQTMTLSTHVSRKDKVAGHQKYLSSTSSSDSSESDSNENNHFSICRTNKESLGEQMATWIVKKLECETQMSTGKLHSRDRDQMILVALDDIISSLQQEKRHLTNRLHKSTNRGQVPPHWSGNPDKKPTLPSGNPGRNPDHVDKKTTTTPPPIERHFSALNPLIQGSATSSDIFNAVLDMVQQDTSTTDQASTNPKPETISEISVPASPRLKPIFEGQELDLDPADIELGFSAISLKKLSLSDLKHSSELSARNSFRNVLHPDLSSVQLPSTTSDSKETHQTAFTNLIRQVADIQKSTNASAERSRSGIAPIPKRGLTFVKIVEENHRGNNSLSAPVVVGVQSQQPIRDSPGTSFQIAAKSNGSILNRKLEPKPGNTKLDKKRNSFEFETKSDDVLEVSNKTAITKLWDDNKEFCSENESNTTMSTRKSRPSVEDIDSSDPSRIEAMVEVSPMKRSILDTDEEDEILLRIIENDVEECPKLDDDGFSIIDEEPVKVDNDRPKFDNDCFLADDF